MAAGFSVDEGDRGKEGREKRERGRRKRGMRRKGKRKAFLCFSPQRLCHMYQTYPGTRFVTLHYKSVEAWSGAGAGKLEATLGTELE